ncbi:Uncharacterised protein [Vibrio cholerae]|nr:Uncharacterised protein [Vibrio cholerae]
MLTPECSPPNTPAIASAFCWSAITSVSAFNLASEPSSSVSFSSCSARRTTIPPSIFARSNACIGWPCSSITKLVISTTGSIERIPQRRSFSCIQSGVCA